jgi:hypothetical protein
MIQIETYANHSAKIADLLLTPYLSLINYNNTYYQELALIDPICDNPYHSDYTGDPSRCMENCGNPQSSSTILGNLQDISKRLYNYIMKLFTMYFRNLSIDLGAWNWYKQAFDKSKMKDTSNMLDSFYPLMSEKYNFKDVNGNGLYGKEIEIKNFISYDDQGKVIRGYGDLMKQYNITRFMVCYNEKLGDPFEKLIVYRRQAGFDDDFSSDDLFNGMLYEIYNGPYKSFTPVSDADYKSQSFCQMRMPVKFTKDMNILADNGGYPFGFGFPSYKEGIQMYNNYKQNILPTLQETSNYNNYCTPEIQINPGEVFDASIFNNINGNTTPYEGNMYCMDVNADSIKSCIKAGAKANDPGNRVTFCYDTKTKFTSELTSTPQVWNKPVPPATGYKVWDLVTNTRGIKNKLRLHWQDGVYTYNANNITNLVWNSLAMTFNIENNYIDQVTIVFGQNENIVGGYIGNSNFIVPVSSYHEDSSDIPVVPFEKHRPRYRVKNRSDDCIFDCKIYVNDDIVFDGKMSNSDGISWRYIDEGSTIRVEAKTVTGSNSLGWTSTTFTGFERGKCYEIYQDIDCQGWLGFNKKDTRWGKDEVDCGY